MKYFGLWSSRADLADWFNEPDETIPPDSAIIVAFYEIGGYGGSALVLYEQEGRIFEVYGGGKDDKLDGQWAPQETTVDALRLRLERGVDDWVVSAPAIAAVIERYLTKDAPPGSRGTPRVRAG